MKIYHTLLLALVCIVPLSAQAQWQWIDKEGRKVFSDRPPPLDVPEKSILKQPAGQRAPALPTTDGGNNDAVVKTPASTTTSTSTSATTTTTTTTNAIPKITKDKELEERKSRTEAAEAAKKKAEEDKNAKLRAENCTRARNAKASFDSGRPMRHTNAQGESVFMEEAARTAEVRRIQEIVNADCKR